MKTDRAISFLCALVIGGAPSTVLAGGSVGFEQVQPLLLEQPATYRWLVSTLRLPSSAFAQVRFASYFRKLGGRRMGPYSFTAQTRESAHPGQVEVVVCTTSRFVDAEDHVLQGDRIFSASRVIEHLSSIVVRDATMSPVPAVCPESC
jgi:hypothetical protein